MSEPRYTFKELTRYCAEEILDRLMDGKFKSGVSLACQAVASWAVDEERDRIAAAAKAVEAPRLKGIITFTVEGRTSFPIDMLRYDDCWPMDADGVQAIAQAGGSNMVEGMGREGRHRRIKMNTINALSPRVARWESFGWKVLTDAD